MKRLLRIVLVPAALALLLLAPAAARATVYQPGLWFVHDETKDDVGAGVASRSDKVPCQGAFMEYTETYQTNIAERGNYKGGTSFFRSGTNAYTGAVSTWELKCGFGYAGEFFVEKGRSYTFSENHGKFIKIFLDGSQLLDGGAWFFQNNATRAAAETGWIPIEIRAGCNFAADVMGGPLHNSFGAGFNTNGLAYAAATWGAAPWRRILDPGDCSLLRIVKSETDYMTLDSVAAEGGDLALVASFAGVPAAGTLTAFWGGSNGGDRPSAWEHSAELGAVAAGSVDSVAYTVLGAGDANFVALRLQRTDYATEPYTQFTAAAAVPRSVPTFDLSCTDVGYTNLTLRAVVAAVGTGASSIASARVQIATDAAFAHVVTNLPLALSGPGSETVYTSGLATNTVYYACVAGTNDVGASGVSATVGPLRTLLPTISTSTIEALEHGLGTLNAAVTVTDWGLDSTGARVRLEAAENTAFGTLAGVSEEVDAPALGVATNLMIVGLRENHSYRLRARIVNSWGFVEYRTLPDDQQTRAAPFSGTPLVWETAPDGTLAVHERLIDNEFAGEAELFLDGVSKGVRAFPASPCRISFEGVPMPAYTATARVVVRVVVSSRPYSEEWSDTVVPGSASYLENKWVYDPSARTLTWTDGYPSENVVRNVFANGRELTIGNNEKKTNPLGVNLDFSPGVEGGYEIVAINSGAFVGYGGESYLTNIVFPSSLRTVGRAAFEQCSTLRGLRMNEGLVDLGTDADNNNCFLGCKALESIGSIPSTLRHVGGSVFAGCSSLTDDIVWPRGVPVVPNGAFNGTSIRSFKAEYGVTHFGTATNGDGRVTGGNNAIRTIDLPVTLEFVSGRMFSDASASKGFSADVWYRGFPKRGWSDGLWWNLSGANAVTNWFEFHHKDAFVAFAETNTQYRIELPATYLGAGRFENQVVRWWKDPDQNPPTVMFLR